MSIAAVTHQIRLSLEDPANIVRREQLRGAVDDFVKAPLDEPEVILFQLEEELRTIHNDVMDHTSLAHIEVFLGVLHGLRSLLSSASIISTWFDVVLRPALRELKLPTTSANHAKELIVSAATHVDERHPDKVSEFRRRLLELYLLDTSVESSGDDILEWTELDQNLRDKKYQWKSNLEDTLVKFGLQCTRELLDEVHSAFETPSSRLQLAILLNSLASDQAFPSLAAKVADHPQIGSLLNSLLLDNSSTLCTIALTVMVKLLPIFAVHAHQELKKMLPRLFVILARIMYCKRARLLMDEPTGPDESSSDGFVETPLLELRPDLGWQRLELTVKAGPPAPPSEAYFSLFLRGPAPYLQDRGYQTPYTVSWEDALDQANIQSKAEALLRSHTVHSGIIRRDWRIELEEGGFVGRSQFANNSLPTHEIETPRLMIVNEGANSGSPTPQPALLELSSSKLRVSLQDMITTSVALKSNREVEIDGPMTTKWPSSLFTRRGDSPSRTNVDLPSEPGSADDGSQLSGRVAEAIARLQREVLLLRNELNLELWLSRQNVQHIGRLHQDRVLSKNAEVERQGLYNKLRQYKAQVQSLEREIREHKEQSSSAKNKYADWNNELQKKLREFREEKRRWISEEAALRTANKEILALFEAQGKLLADAEKDVFELKTRQKENEHKIDRLHDYERQIEQHVRMQKLWDVDFERFNARGREVEQMKASCKQMEMILDSCEKSLAKMEEEARVYRRQNQALEGRLALMQKKYDAFRRLPESEITAIVAEKSDLALANAKLREENAELKDEMEEMRAAVEGLRAQLSGQRGLIYEPRPRPTVAS
ncbi:hypothetical protein F5J12DRAFT_806523 [Pisolithus orientalis]|uniref:uncharacterized protein n=1 Tax=Pisolithus orientalis TaxID=936130 RepID=UPI00222571EF|nr:uncharacterized protein F5J12DRAFT_806523 [Pisolithus orientalis]KAI6028623.1 hypothetical protein F5J12DRAFT_806523 [Pisolithus orientalis]